MTAVAAALLYAAPLVPPWRGEMNWESCAAVAPVKPEQAIRIAMAEHGFTSWGQSQTYITVTPFYVNESAYVFGVSCDGGVSVTTTYGLWPMQTDGRPHFSWRVVLGGFSGMGMCVYHDFVDWNTGQFVGSHRAC